MGKGRKRKKTDPAEKVVNKIRRAIEEIEEDLLPDELFDDVLWLVERGLERKIYELLEEEEYEDEAYELLGMALQEAGYRLYLPEALHGPKEPEEGDQESATLIPFAIIFAVPILVKDAENFPIILPETIRRSSEERVIRQILDIGETDSIFLDKRLYRIDHAEWRRESAARRYLISLASYIENPGSKLIPLSRDYRRPATHVIEDPEADEITVVQRVICGAVLETESERADEHPELEDRIFGEGEDGLFDRLAALIKEELAEHLTGPQFDAFIYPHFVELEDVPECGLQLQRSIQISVETERAMQTLLEIAPSGEVIEPLLYVSRHGEDDFVEEIRLAAYAREGEDEEPFFTYIWEIVHDLEDPEDVSDTIMEISKQLNARILLVEDILPDDRCDDCGEKLFQGPGGLAHSPD